MKLRISILLAAWCISCQLHAQDKPSIIGTWQSLGSGWMLNIDHTNYALYDVTDISCQLNRQANLDEIRASLELVSDTLMLHKGVICYPFIRTTQVPERCGMVFSEDELNDPLYNFEVFSATVKENYAFLALNGINWDSLYLEQKNKLSTTSSDVALYSVIKETIERLQDNHGFIEASEEVYQALEQSSDGEESIEEDLPTYGDFGIADMVAKHHLEEEMTTDSWLIRWGRLKDEIGYIQLKAMWLHADLGISESLMDSLGFVDAYIATFQNLYEGNYIDKEVEAVRNTMDRVMSDLMDMESIVIDIRFNGGGQDAVSFEILRRFNPHRLQIARQKLRYQEGYSPTTVLHLDAHAQAYTRPVYVLTSQQTASAAEALAIATLSMDHVKRIGSHTSGDMSTALEKKLPNGWPFALSNEVYMDTKENCYENIGIPVDFELNYPDDRQTFFRSVADDLSKDKQNLLNAINQLSNE